jgi:hypothetical protein
MPQSAMALSTAWARRTLVPMLLLAVVRMAHVLPLSWVVDAYTLHPSLMRRKAFPGRSTECEPSLQRRDRGRGYSRLQVATTAATFTSSNREDGEGGSLVSQEASPRVGVLLLNLGGPETGEDVEGA